MSGERIFIAESESAIAKDLQSMLEKHGYIVAGIVASVEQISARALAAGADLALVAMRLAGAASGVSAAEALLERNRIPVILLASPTDAAGRELDNLPGACGYLLKPVSETMLLANIRMALRRAALEQTQRQREASFRAMIEFSSDIISIIDPEGFIRFVSPSVETVLGYRPEELVGRHAFELVHPDDVDCALEHWQYNLRESVSGLTTTFRFRHKDGSWRVLECTGSYQMNHTAVAGVIMNSRDITDRARMEEALRTERDRARKYLDTARVMLVALNENGEITLINPHALQLLGYREDELLGANWFETCAPAQQRQEMQRDWGRFFQPGERPADSWDAPVVTSSEEIRMISWHNAALSVEGGRIRSLLCSGEDITERIQAEERLRYNATHDPLTGLPNRNLFLERLSTAVERIVKAPDRRYAVLFLDLDSFKLVNDSYGHTLGDHLLTATARRIESCLKPGDTVARISGDEFFILLEDAFDSADVILLVKRILKEVSAPLALDGVNLNITASIGIVMCNRTHQFVDDIIRDADIAMYQAKERGKNGYAFFVPSMRTQPIARLNLERDLRRAVENQEFMLYYQPILSLDDFQLVGMEALARWKHGENGLTMPGEFIPILEETGLILPLGDWILNQACRKVHAWETRFRLAPSFTMSVNVSMRQFLYPMFVEQVRQALFTSGARPQQLILELTESIFLGNAEPARTIVQRLKELGVVIHIDDFGTGYSSYSSLHALPFDAIKIDRSFIDHLDKENNKAEFIRSILKLASSIGATTIAEGVESIEQVKRVKTMGCDFVQGFYISKPLNEEAIERWLEKFILENPPRLSSAAPRAGHKLSPDNRDFGSILYGAGEY